MSVYELNREQIEELKVRYLMATQDSVSYGEIVDADSLVDDLTIYEEFGCFDFVEEDF